MPACTSSANSQPSPSRLRSALFYTAGIAVYWNVVRPITQADDEDVEEEDDEEEDDVAQWGDAVELSSEGTQGKKEGSIFVPLGFTRERPTKRYQPSDPEWKVGTCVQGSFDDY